MHACVCVCVSCPIMTNSDAHWDQQTIKRSSENSNCPWWTTKNRRQRGKPMGETPSTQSLLQHQWLETTSYNTDMCTKHPTQTAALRLFFFFCLLKTGEVKTGICLNPPPYSNTVQELVCKQKKKILIISCLSVSLKRRHAYCVIVFLKKYSQEH